MNYYLAIDIGASSGRLILGHVENGLIKCEEIHRFENRLYDVDGHLCWDYKKLFDAMCEGLIKCKEQNKIPVSMSIDTWGVDFVLLDENDKVIGNTVGYRDSRTNGMDDELSKTISPEELYARTGIQKAIFNTIYQLVAVKKQHPEYLEKAKTLLMTPEYFDFLFTGQKKCEYTIASTSQLLDPNKKDWDYELLEKLGIPTDIFLPISTPGTVVGHFSEEVKNRVGFDCEVVLCAAHDTGSAVMAVPVFGGREAVYISSGTWSLMGVERMEADLRDESRIHNFTNEGGYDYRFRYLKNIMGLWMIQSVRKEIAADMSFGEICAQAAETGYKGRVDVNDNRFLAPLSMTEEVKKALKEAGYPEPSGVAELAACIYESLADSYGETIKEIEELTGKKYDSINIVGGGCNATYLNELTAKATGKTVYAGPSEATAIGNLLVQMIKSGEYADLETARKAVYDSFGVKEIK